MPAERCSVAGDDGTIDYAEYHPGLMAETVEVRVPADWAGLARSDGLNIGRELRRRGRWVWLRMTGYEVLEAIAWGQKADSAGRVKRGLRTVAVLMDVEPVNIRSLPGPDGSQVRAERAMKLVTSGVFFVTRVGGDRPEATLWQIADHTTPEGTVLKGLPYWRWEDVKEFMKWHALGVDVVGEYLDGVAEWRER